MAEVKAPLTWPKRVDSSRSEGMAPVLTGTKRRSRRGELGVDGLGDQLFAGAGFALDEDGGARGRDLGDDIEEPEHGLGFADDVLEVIALLEGALELDDLGLGLVAGDGGADIGEQLLVVPGLLDEVFSAGADRVHHVAYCPEGGDHDDRQVGMETGDAGKQVDAGLAGEGEVEQKEVELVAGEQVEAFGSVGGEGDVEAFEGEQGVERLADGGLVVDDEQAWKGCGGGGGSDRGGDGRHEGAIPRRSAGRET